MAREQTSLSRVKDRMRQACRRSGWSMVTTKSLALEEPTDCASCQLFLALMTGISIFEIGDWARAIVEETRAITKRVTMRRMIFCCINGLLKMHCVDGTRKPASGGPCL